MASPIRKPVAAAKPGYPKHKLPYLRCSYAATPTPPATSPPVAPQRAIGIHSQSVCLKFLYKICDLREIGS